MGKILEPKYKYFLELGSLEGAKAGQIFWAGRNYNRRNRTSHYFAVIDNPETEGYLYGAMLSSSIDYDYVSLEAKYFREIYTNGEKFEYPNKATLFAPKKYIKFDEWAPFYLVGELTEEGTEVIKGMIGNMEPEICRWNLNIEVETNFIK